MTAGDDKFGEWARLWRNQPTEHPSRGGGEVLMKVKERSRKFERTLVWRDVREAVTGLFGAGVMVWVSCLAPGWLPKVGAAAAVAEVAYVIARLSRVRREHGTAPEHLPLVGRLRAEIAKVEAQADLLRSVRSWYVTPLAVGATVWLASLVPAIGMRAGPPSRRSRSQWRSPRSSPRPSDESS